jgi:hypothetical protein
VLQEARQHAEALLRELTIIVDGGRDNAELPQRLFNVIEAVQRAAGGLNTGAEREIEDAIKRGDDTIDFEMVMPRSFAGGAPHFARLLDDIDEFCRTGDLLTLETPPEVRRFQRWYLDELQRQLQGGEPIAWSEWRRSEAAASATRS